jgi:phenylacetate-coenzyme A ligase PaaK-like adenylate-forming protein
MTTTAVTGLDLLRARMSGAMGTQMPGHLRRLRWSGEQLAVFQRDRLRALLARAIERSPFHAARLSGVDPDRFELADLPRLPLMTKAQLTENFDAAVTDPRLTRDLVERHLSGSAVEASLLLGDYVALVSGGSSGLRGIFVQTLGEYADFVGTIMRRLVPSGGLPPEGLVIGLVVRQRHLHRRMRGRPGPPGPRWRPLVEGIAH